ncbi:segregation/condensation protein A [bacterium]|nr:segregation/condensation protein A [candidate division CSSED10-310 bacterium]
MVMESASDLVRVKLELFEGPLDLLLHLIRMQHIDIAAIPIAHITQQYLDTIRLMKELDLDIAGEYLVMAATLILIKSRMLLPPSSVLNEEESPESMKEELIRRLNEYQVFKEAGHHLEKLESDHSRFYPRPVGMTEEETHTQWVIDASLGDLLAALQDICRKHSDLPQHLVKPKPVSIRVRMAAIMQILVSRHTMVFRELFTDCSSRKDVIGTFLALLELIRLHQVTARQRTAFGDIRIVRVSQPGDPP